MKTFATRLAEVLGWPNPESPKDEDRLIAYAEQLRLNARAAEQERDIALGNLAAAEELIAEMSSGVKHEIERSLLTFKTDAAIERAYRDGKLRVTRDEACAIVPNPREARLRAIANEHGLSALIAEIADMPAVVPVDKRTLGAGDPPRESYRSDGLASVAGQLGLDPQELADYAATMTGDKR